MPHNNTTNSFSRKFLTIVSNIAFLFPFYLLMSQGRYALAVIVGLVFITSSMYHYYKPIGIDSPWIHKKRKLKHQLLLWSDVLLTLSFGVYVFFVHLIPNLPRKDSLQHEIVLIFFILGLASYAFPSHNYEQRHSLWHILAASALYLVFI